MESRGLPLLDRWPQRSEISFSALMVTGGASVSGLGLDVAVMFAVTAALIALAARLYPNIVQ